MRVQLSVGQLDGPPLDVVLDVDEDLPVHRAAVELSRITGQPTNGLWITGARVDDHQPVAESPLVDGAIVHLSEATAATARPLSPARGWQLHVVGGPGAGSVAALPMGAHELGRSSAIGFCDRSMSRRHALLDVGADGATLCDLGSANGTFLEGEPVPEEATPVEPGRLFRLGDTLLVLRPVSASDAAVEPSGPGTRAFVRAPRILPSPRAVRVQLPQEPTAREPRRFPLVMVVAPLLIGTVLAVVMHSPMYLMFAVASPLMMISNTVADRRHTAREERRAREEYEQELARARQRIETALAEETTRRRGAHPDAAAVLLTAVLPGRRLWERRRTDPDALDLRVGTADLPAEVVVSTRGGTDDVQEERTVRAVPATVALRASGVVGLAGPAEPLAGLVRWVVLQLAIHHPPRDLSLTVLAPRGRGDWNWVRWLPHVRPADGDGPVAFVGNDPETVTARVAELTALVKARRDAAAGSGRLPAESFPAHVLVVHGFRALRATPGLAQVLRDGPAVGVYAVCADEEERFLPEAATATAVFDPVEEAELEVRRSGCDPVGGVLAEPVSAELAETAARALAPLRDVSVEDDEAVLPDSVRLLDVLGLEPPTVDGIRARWQLEGRSTRMIVGSGLHGTFGLDLRTDGPHGLIAGTTGAGKSELLQTMIAGLAVANRPDALNFVLVDYKGGSAFKDCVHLPHTVGMVTDLDAHLVRRALTSLGAELTFREHWLAGAGVKDIDDYHDLQAREPGRPALPRLLIVIDEFASMARELPDFVPGLVNVAQRGRSLGIHLILATQRPSGVVSPEIRANTNLRISLRVTDGADSSDVLDAPDAARIPKSAPGRGFARLGHGGLVPFQAGRIGGRRPGQGAVAAAVPFVVPLGWHQVGYAAPQKPATAARRSDVEITDLSVLVEAVRGASVAEDVPAQRSPWLEALPPRILLDHLDAPAAGAPAPPGLPYGLQDLPARQERRVAAFDPATDGHLLVIGSPTSGRSQVLRTLAGSAGARCSTSDVHLYALDCGNGALLPLADLPQCGAVVTRTQTERAVRLLDRLKRELERRQQVLAESGVADITEQRRSAPADQRLPHILLLLDRWEGFTPMLGEIDGGRLTDILMAIVREGASVGISVVMTGDRSLGTARLASLTDSKLVLRLADRGDYPLIGVPARQVPGQMPPGRAVTIDGAVETQVALLSDDESGRGQAAAIAEVAKAAHVRDALVPRSARPFRVDVLPSRISFEQAWELRPAQAGLGFALVGVGGDELVAAGPDLVERGPAFVVAGPARSGKSTVLAVMAESLLRQGTAIVVCAPKASPLRTFAGREGVLDVIEAASTPADRWRELLTADPGRPLVLLLDDGDVLRDVPASQVFREVLTGAAGPGRALVVAGNADSICTGLSGWQVEARRSRQGLLLSPQGSTDGDLIGARIPRSVVGRPVRPGCGLLHLGDNTLLTVAVPTPPAP